MNHDAPVAPKSSETDRSSTSTDERLAAFRRGAPTVQPKSEPKPAKSTPAPARNVAVAKAATPEPAAEKAAKVEPRPSVLDVNRHEPPTPPAAAEGPIRRSAPSFRVDRFQDLRGLGY